MSSDVMIVCQEYDNDSSALMKAVRTGKDLPPRRDTPPEHQAYMIDEASMGDPWTEFGNWFVSRYCKAPGIFEQLAGVTDHNYTLFTETDYAAVEDALQSMTHSIEDTKKFMLYMKNLIGKHISTENW